MVPYATGERELAAEYLLYSSPDDLFLYDRGYPAFWLFAFHAQEQRHYCARVRHDFHSEVKAFVADGAKERIVVLTPNQVFFGIKPPVALARMFHEADPEVADPAFSPF